MASPCQRATFPNCGKLLKIDFEIIESLGLKNGEFSRNYKRKKLCVRDLLNQEIRLYYFKNHVDDSEYQQSYFGTKLVMKIASGLS